MLACVVWCLVRVALAIHHTCLSHTYHFAIHHTCLLHTWHLEHFRPAMRTSTLDYNLALLSVTDLCAIYTYYSLCAFQAPQILQISTKKGPCNLGTTASQVSQTSCQLYRSLLALVRTLSELGKTLPLAEKSDTTATT